MFTFLYSIAMWQPLLRATLVMFPPTRKVLTVLTVVCLAIFFTALVTERLVYNALYLEWGYGNNAHTHKHAQKHSHTCRHTCTHTYLHTCTHINTHVCTHAPTHMLTHTHTSFFKYLLIWFRETRRD
jgi:hypothetical protein